MKSWTPLSAGSLGIGNENVAGEPVIGGKLKVVAVGPRSTSSSNPPAIGTFAAMVEPNTTAVVWPVDTGLAAPRNSPPMTGGKIRKLSTFTPPER